LAKAPKAPLVKLWGHLTVKGMTRPEIRPVLDKIAARAPIMANRTLALVRKMFNFAIEHDWVESSPCHMIKRLAPERQHDRVLSEMRFVRCGRSWTVRTRSSRPSFAFAP
jgi:site-specific recombinase XerD